MTVRRSRRGLGLLVAGLLAVAGSLLGAASAGAAGRIALILGEGDYQSLPQLAAPANNAALMGETLQALGFDATVLTDATRDEMTKALADFARKAKDADVAVLYYSGAAVQFQGINRLVPVDAGLTDAQAVTGGTVSLDQTLGQLISPDRPLLVFVETAAGNPLPPALQGASGPGLAQPALSGRAPVMVALSAEPGRAPVAEPGAFGSFTLALGSYLPTPDRPLADELRWVERDVQTATGSAQVPWVYSTLDAAYSLTGTAPAKPAAPAAPATPPQIGSATTPPAAPAAPAADTAAPGAAGPELAALPPAAKEAALLAPGGRDAAPRPEGAPKPDLSRLPTLRQIAPGLQLMALPPIAAAIAPAPVAPGLRLKPVEPADRIRPQGFEVLASGVRMPILDPAELPKAVQTELARVGCYQGAIDGDFGPGSQDALDRYYKAKGTEGDTKPTDAVYGQLLGETAPVCKASAPVAAPAAPKPAAPKPAAPKPAAQAAPKPAAPAPAPAPAPQGGCQPGKICLGNGYLSLH